MYMVRRTLRHFLYQPDNYVKIWNQIPHLWSQYLRGRSEIDTQDSVGTSLDESITPSFTVAGFSGIRSWELVESLGQCPRLWTHWNETSDFGWWHSPPYKNHCVVSECEGYQNDRAHPVGPHHLSEYLLMVIITLHQHGNFIKTWFLLLPTVTYFFEP